MYKHARSSAVTLAAASNADLIFTNRVASAVQERLLTSVTVVEAKALSHKQTCTALVSAISAARLDSLLQTLRFDKIAHRVQSGRTLVLIHPNPEEGHYRLAQRFGLSEIVCWPQDLDQWFATLSVSSGESAGPAAADTGQAAIPLLGESEAMKKIRRQILRIAAFDTNVLITGETGTGKECVAQSLHQASRRRTQALINLNCAALPEHLIESELFGYERGAFTGANAAYAGKFGLAEGGTLFLDEIGEMPIAAQAKILRVIETREYYRLGGARVQKADVRLIAATHRDLETLCGSHHFRLDLYFRLNIARIELPALRDRSEDILPLARHFLRELGLRMERTGLSLSESACQALMSYRWPGNVRELRSVIEASLINADRSCIELDDLPSQLTRWHTSANQAVDERSHLISILDSTRWNKTEAAKTLRWSRMKLYRKLKQYGLQTEKDVEL